METADSILINSEYQLQAKNLSIKELMNISNRYPLQKSQIAPDNASQQKNTATSQRERETYQNKQFNLNIYQNLASAREGNSRHSIRVNDYPQSARTHSTQLPVQSPLPLSAPFAINISKKNFDTIPPQLLLNGFKSVVILDISLNKFTSFPEEILQIVNLKTLKLDHNFLIKLPMEISKLSYLENLSASNNLLTSLPRTISELRNTLTLLNVGKNRLEYLPNELSDLPLLKTLWINNNSFTALPNTLDALESLREFALEWFKYTNPPMAIVQNDKSRVVIEHLFRLCERLREKNVKQITFTSFIEHFSITDGPSLIYAKDSHNRNLLHIAALEEEVGIVKHLLDEAPELSNELDQDQQTPLSLAIREDSFWIAMAILNHGCDPNIGGGALGSSLHLAITKLNFELVMELLSHGARPNDVDVEGNTPLHLLFSIFSKNIQVAIKLAETLLNHGADPNAKNSDSWAPIHLAVRRGHLEGLKWMVKYNKDMQNDSEKQFVINTKGGADQWTPLHLAVNLGHYEMVSMLIECGADFNVRTKTGKSVRSVCRGSFFFTKLIIKGEKEWIRQNILKENDESLQLQENTPQVNKTEYKTETLSSPLSKDSPKTFKGPNTKDAKKASFFRPNQRSFSLLNGNNEDFKFLENKKQPVQKNELSRALEDSTTCDGDEQTSRDYSMKEKSTRIIPKSPNNIQKLQVAQSYRSYLLNQSPSKNVLKSVPDLISQALVSGVRSNPTLITFNPISPLKTLTTENKLIKPTQAHALPAKSQKQVLQGKAVKDSPLNTNQLKPRIYPEAKGYIQNFTTCSEEIRKFQNMILDEELELSERLKYIFYLKVLHLKIDQRIQKLNSQFMPLELFIISEFLDDEAKRERFLNTNSTNQQLNNDVAPRALLYAFEHLRNKYTPSSNLLKTEICLAFAQIVYPSSRHFIEHILKNSKTATRPLLKEAVSAILTLRNAPVQAMTTQHLNDAYFTKPNNNQEKAAQIHTKTPLKNPKKRAESMDQMFKSVKSTKANTAEAENLIETESNLTTPRTLLEAQNMKEFNNTRVGSGMPILLNKIQNPEQNRRDLTEEDVLEQQFGKMTNRYSPRPAVEEILKQLEEFDIKKPQKVTRQQMGQNQLMNYNIDEGRPNKTNQITMTPKSALMNNYFSSKY